MSTDRNRERFDPWRLDTKNERPRPQTGPSCSGNLAYTLNEEPQPQVLFTLGFSNLKPAPSKVST